MRYTCCSIRTCLSRRVFAFSRRSSSAYIGSKFPFASVIDGTIDRRETSLTFQNYTDTDKKVMSSVRVCEECEGFRRSSDRRSEVRGESVPPKHHHPANLRILASPRQKQKEKRVNTNLVDHIALWMPALVSIVAIDLHELLENRTRASRTFCGEPGRVVVVTVHVAFVLVIRVLWTKERSAQRAGEVLDVEFLACGVRQRRIYVLDTSRPRP
jgi:hypothetical protein